MTSSAPVITDQVWWRMADPCMSEPVPLAEADLSKLFVYGRLRHAGVHPAAMSFLLALNHGHADGIDAAKAMRLAHPSGTGRCPAGDHPGRGLSLFGGQVRLCGELALEPSASRPGADTRLGQFESVSARSSR